MRTEVNPLRDIFDAAVRGYSIKLTCQGCRHSSVFSAHALWWLFLRKGWNDRLPHLRRRAVCTECLGRKRRKVRQPQLELVHAEPTDKTLPMPPLHEWKAMLRRVR